MLARLKSVCLKAWMQSMAGKDVRQATPDKGQITSIALWQFGGLGDMLLATPVVEALQKAYPQAEIRIWCSHPPFAEFLKRFPKVKGICEFSVYGFDSRTLPHSGTRRDLRRIADAMAEQKPDILVCLHVPALLDWWTVEWWLVRRLAPGFSLGFDPRFMHDRSVFDVSLNAAERDQTHYTRLYRRLLEKAGIPCGEATYFPVTDEEKVTARALLDEGGPQNKRQVCVHIGARRLKLEGRMWPLERFSALAGRLLNAGFLPVLIGATSEQDMAASLCETVPFCVNLVGRTSLGEMAALIGFCDGFIGHDSGPFHVAAAVGTPCVAICGRPDAEPEYLNYDRDDIVVFIADTPEQVTVEAVLNRAMDIFGHG